MDLGGCLISIYLLSSILSIYLHFIPKEEAEVDYSFNIGFIPSLLYCLLICITLFPYYKINTNKRKPFREIQNIQYFNYITYFYIVLFFGMLAFMWKDIVYGIFQQNLADLRQEMHEGNLDNALSRQTTFIGKLVGYGAATISAGSTYMIPFFFYSICFTDNKKWHNILILISSFSSIIMGIIVIDRSCVIRWFLMLLISYFLFKPYLLKKSKRFLKKMGYIFGGLLIFYFVAVTLARFGDDEGGASGGVIRYAGQAFPNFCLVLDNADVVQYSFRKVFPAMDSFIFHSDPDLRTYVMRKGDSSMKGFCSFLGTLYLDLGFIGLFIVPIFLFVISSTICKKMSSCKIVCLKDMIYVFMVAVIPMYGLFSYYYGGYPATMNLFFMIFLMSKFKFKKEPC